MAAAAAAAKTIPNSAWGEFKLEEPLVEGVVDATIANLKRV